MYVVYVCRLMYLRIYVCACISPSIYKNYQVCALIIQATDYACEYMHVPLILMYVEAKFKFIYLNICTFFCISLYVGITLIKISCISVCVLMQ